MENDAYKCRYKGNCLLSAVLLLTVGAVTAQTPLSPEQLIERSNISELEWSASGQRLALVVTEPVTDEGQLESIWLYDSEDDLLRRFTTAGEENRRPRWSPSGDRLAFLSTRGDGETQIYVMPMNGGEAQALTGEKSGVTAFEWSPDGDAIAYLSADPAPDDEEEKKKLKDDEIVVSETVRPTHLRLIDVDSRTTRSLTEGAWRVSAFAWRPDGAGLLVTATDNFSTDLLTDRFFAVSRDGRKMKELARPDGPVSNLSVSPDHRFLAYIGSTGGGPVPHGIFLQPLDGGHVRDLTGGTLDRMIADYAWARDGSILAVAADGFGDRLVRISMDGLVRTQKTFPDQSIVAFDVAGSVIAYGGGSAVDPKELWIADGSDERQVSHLNDDFTTLIEPELIHYVAADGIDIEAALFTPEKMSRPRRGWKTVLLIHGGPSGRWMHRINDWAQLLVARGYAVLAPNIRGSIGYGLDFIRSNRHDWGGADYRDAIAGIDYLIERGITDPEKIAVAGWSYGGYMSAWAITQTNRFKAAVVGAAMTDLAVEYGTETADINAYDTWYLGTPYENLDDFIRMSPMTYVKNASTPALILIGEEDEIDPIAQSRQFYRGLKRYGVETELVIYPREPHGIKERRHKIDVMNRMVEWIDKHTK